MGEKNAIFFGEGRHRHYKIPHQDGRGQKGDFPIHTRALSSTVQSARRLLRTQVLGQIFFLPQVEVFLSSSLIILTICCSYEHQTWSDEVA